MSKENPIKKRTLWFTIVNTFLFISTIIVTYITLTFGTLAGQVDTNVEESWFYILTFTVQSNLLLGLVASVSAVYGIISLKKNKPIPHALLTFYLMATSAGMLTVLTVLFFLAPNRALHGRSYFDMILGPMFFFHLFNPVLASFNLIFFTPATRLSLKDRLFAVLPPVAYAVPYILNVVILHTWYDFYSFTFGGNNWAILPVFIVISVITFSIASGLAFFHNHQKIIKK